MCSVVSYLDRIGRGQGEVVQESVLVGSTSGVSMC